METEGSLTCSQQSACGSSPEPDESSRTFPTSYSNIRGCIQKFPDWVDKAYNNKHSLRSNIKGYGGGKTH
jgi:hypothetical protein